MKTYKINEIPYKKILGRNIKAAGEKESINLFWGAAAVELKVAVPETVYLKPSDTKASQYFVNNEY